MGRKKTPMGTYTPTKEEEKARRWCIKHQIYISPFALGRRKWHVDIEIHGRTHRSPDTFGPGEIWEAVYSYYHYYYKKRKE